MLIEYVVGEEESFVFLVGHDRFRLERVGAGQETLAALVDSLRTSSSEGATAAARELDRLLIAPVAADLVAGKRLLVSPDGPLFHLPFAALHDGRGFLIERYALAYVPSAGAIDRELRGRRPRRETIALAVGNPATFRADTLLAAQRDGSRWSFGELPHAEEEARRVASRFPKSTLLTGSSAREELVKAMSPDATIIHFATHGLLDEREPMLSGILLAQDDDEVEDGLLQAHEVVTMRIPADLVTLSACEMGRGRIERGEGVIGLTRAFIHAGTRGLLLSLWVVPDRSTMELMETFYESYLENMDAPDLALQHAQVAAITAGRPVHEWAGFLFVGEADPWVGRGMSPGRVAAVTFGLAGATALLLAARRKHARR
jgi:CHAT domain-containing protein